LQSYSTNDPGLAKEENMGLIWQDARYGAYMLLKKPSFTAAAVIALALGIGANTFVFSSIDALLLSPLPFPNLDRIVMIYERVPSQGVDRNEAAPANYLDWRREGQSFEHVGLYRWWGGNLTSDGTPERVQGFLITANLFDVLGAKPQLGRGFLPEEEQPGQDDVLILSHGLWQRRFGGDPNVIGKAVTVNSTSRVIVGVMAPDYNFPRGAEVLAPLAFTPQEASSHRNHSYLSVGLLKPSVTLSQAQSELDAISRRLEADYPATNTGRSAVLIPLLTDTVRMYRPALLLLMASVAFVLLIGCANVGNLMLARAAGRTREIAIRSALGASRWHITRQMLAESVLLALVGGAFGILVGYWALSLAKSTMPGEMIPFVPNWTHLGLNLKVLAFTMVLSTLAGVLFGLAPALQASKTTLNEALKESGSTATFGEAGHRLRSVLMVSEVALSLILLIGAGLLIKSFMGLLKTNPGFRPDNVLTMELVLPTAKYPEAAARAQFLKDLTEHVEALGGIESAGFVNHLPLGGSNSSTSFLVEGLPEPPPGQEFGGRYRVCTPDYFRALGITVLEGRGFTDQDKEGAEPVIIVNETLARKYWPEQDAIGKRMRLTGPPESNPWMKVVGVIADVKFELDSRVTPEFHLPVGQDPWNSGVLVARTRIDPMSVAAPIRAEVEALDREQPVFDIRTMEAVRLHSVFQQQFCGYLMGIFGLLALVMAGVGVYGVMSYSVGQRTREIGIRVALGASWLDTLKLVVGQGLLLTLLGIAIGVAGSVGIAKAMAGLLYGVSGVDATVFTAIPLLLGVVSVAACYIPARRAFKVDPTVALRYE
jgi:putative ABC transport system permease protein